MKMQKYVLFAKKNLKINMKKTRNIVKLNIISITQGNIEALRIAYVFQNI